jgi:hypothetical protein
MTRFTPQWLQAGSYAASQDRRLIGALWPAAASSGCAVTASSGMVVNVAAGQVAVPSQNNTGSTLCSSDAIEAVTVAAAPGSGTNRIDLIICQPRGNDLDGGTFTDFIFSSVTGTASATPSPPATPPGAVALAQILVIGASAAVVQGNITDVRPGNLAIFGSAPPVGYGRGVLAQATATANSATQSTPGGTVWMTAPAITTDGTRRIKVTFYSAIMSGGAVGDVGGIRLMEGATLLQLAQMRTTAVGGPGQISVMGVWQAVPAAGSHTYTVQVYLTTGTSMVCGGAATNPGILIVEDIGI